MNFKIPQTIIKGFVLLAVSLATSPLLAAQDLNSFTVEKDIEWAKPKGFSLTMDVYTPKTGKSKYPVLVIYHGGGWLINNKSIMDQMSQYVVEHGEYVVCNVNYRLLGDLENTTTLNEIVEDAFGSLLWVKENIAKHQGDPSNVIVTGDSAGGHLAAMVVNSGINLSDTRFETSNSGFKPTYVPEGKSLKKLIKTNSMEVQAAIYSYGAFDMVTACQNGFESASNFFWTMGGAQARNVFGNAFNVNDNPELYQTVSPIYNIPNVSTRKLPPTLCTVGSKDNTTTPASISKYVDALKKAGQSVEYWVHNDRPHAFLDSGSNEYLGITFEKDAPIALDKMIGFLNQIFYP